MKDKVAILGSGFSAGLAKDIYPVTKEFLNKAFGKYNGNAPVGNLSVALTAIRQSLDLLDIETLYDMFAISRDMKEIIRYGSLDFEPDVLVQQINWLIRNYIFDQMHEGQHHEVIPKAAKVLNKLKASTIITMNWDLILDFLLVRPDDKRPGFPLKPTFYGVQPDRYLAFRDRGWMSSNVSLVSHKEIDLIKLHGSLNWFRCRDKGHFLIADPQVAEGYDKDPDSRCPIDFSKLDILLLPPSSQKEYSATPFPALWRKAFDSLCFAKEIVVFGCSFRDADFRLTDLVRRLHLRWAPIPRNARFLKKLVVVDIDASVSRKLTSILQPEESVHFTSIDDYLSAP